MGVYVRNTILTRISIDKVVTLKTKTLLNRKLLGSSTIDCN